MDAQHEGQRSNNRGRSDEPDEEEKWTRVVSRRSMKAVQKFSPMGGQLEAGGRSIQLSRNWRHEANITSFYFTHFPVEANEKLLWWHFKKWGDVREVYIAKRLNKEGRRYGFVRFKDVKDAKGLELRLDNIFINEHKLYVNLPRFDRSARQEAPQANKLAGGKKTIEESCRDATNHGPPRRSYVDAVTMGVCQGHKRVDETRYSPVYINLEVTGRAWCEGTWTGKLKKMMEVDALEDRLAWELGYSVDSQFLGDDMVLLPGLSDEKARALIQSETEKGDSIFYELKKWSPLSRPSNRIVWLQLWGFPVQAWEIQSFRKVVAAIGDIIEPDDDTEDRRRFDRARLLVRTPLPPTIRSAVNVRVGELEYKVWIVEEAGSDGGLTKRRPSPSEGWSESITSDDDGVGCDEGDDVDTNFSFSPELSNRSSSPTFSQRVHCRTHGCSRDGEPLVNTHTNETFQDKANSLEATMLESISGKVNLGDSFAAPQKTAAYTKRDTGQNIPQDGCRHNHHTQGNNLNVERKDAEGQTCIGELQKQITQTPSPIPLEQNGPQRLKGPLESQGGCNKEFLYPVEHMGINEGQTHKEGRPSEITGPLMSVEGCHREEPSSETHSLKVNSDKFVKVYSRQKPTSQSGARMSQPAIQHSSIPLCSLNPAATQPEVHNQPPVNSGGRLSSVIQCSDELKSEAQHLWNLGKELGMETKSDSSEFLQNYTSMECRDRDEAKELGNRRFSQ